MDGLCVEKTFFEEHGNEMLNNAGINKAQFAKSMGVAPQNVGKLLSTKNVLTLDKVSKLLNVSLNYLIHGTNEQLKDDVHGCLFVNGNPVIINSRAELEEFLRDNK